MVFFIQILSKILTKFSFKLGKLMLNHVLEHCEKDGNFESVYLWVYLKLNLYFKFFIKRHVQVNNDSAIEFYKKFGFEIVEKKEQYYKRIEPADAFVLKKSFDKK